MVAGMVRAPRWAAGGLLESTDVPRTQAMQARACGASSSNSPLTGGEVSVKGKILGYGRGCYARTITA